MVKTYLCSVFIRHFYSCEPFSSHHCNDTLAGQFIWHHKSLSTYAKRICLHISYIRHQIIWIRTLITLPCNIQMNKTFWFVCSKSIHGGDMQNSIIQLCHSPLGCLIDTSNQDCSLKWYDEKLLTTIFLVNFCVNAKISIEVLKNSALNRLFESCHVGTCNTKCWFWVLSAKPFVNRHATNHHKWPVEKSTC